MANLVLVSTVSSLAALVGLSSVPDATMMPSTAVEACLPIGGRLVGDVTPSLEEFGLGVVSAFELPASPTSTQNIPGGGFCSTTGAGADPLFCSVKSSDPTEGFCSTHGNWAVQPCSVSGGSNYSCSAQGDGGGGTFICSVDEGATKFCSVTKGGQGAPNQCSTFGAVDAGEVTCSAYGAGVCSVENGAGGDAECSAFFAQPGDSSKCSSHGGSATCSVYPGTNAHKCTSDVAGACSAYGGAPDKSCSVIGGGGHQEEGSEGGVWCYGGSD